MYVLAVSAAFHNFTFWGVAALFPLYVTATRGLTEEESSRAYGIFFGAAMALPLPGGYLLPRLGRCSRAVLAGFLLLGLGAWMLSFAGGALELVAFALVALGYGLFWPPLVILLGSLYDLRPDLRDQGFTLFYALAGAGIFLAHVFSTLLLDSSSGGFSTSCSGAWRRSV